MCLRMASGHFDGSPECLSRICVPPAITLETPKQAPGLGIAGLEIQVLAVEAVRVFELACLMPLHGTAQDLGR
jgi:hypothetical protein